MVFYLQKVYHLLVLCHQMVFYLLMVFLFLRDARSTLVVVVNIPLALLIALLGLWLCGQTINLMTLGGLALAVGQSGGIGPVVAALLAVAQARKALDDLSDIV